ncbi:MAG TPA: DUF4340 domain-containing protein [Spirochaetota bacterium]|nr:DUF4340 domain-containing protein [Spirochaetota bacterium]
MRKRILISSGVIILLLAAIAVKKCSFKRDYSLKHLNVPADTIVIKSLDYSLELKKQGDRWLIGQKGYPADNDLIRDLEKKIAELPVVDLVSTKGFFEPYELSEGQALDISLMAKGELLRRVSIGKQGLTNNHVYVRIDNGREVFLASGITKNEFKQDIDNLRDKKNFEIKSDSIEKISINYQGKEYIFYKEKVAQKENSNSSGESSEQEWKCKGYENIQLNSSKINSMLYTFSPLRAAKFYEGEIKEKPLCIVRIFTGDGEKDLNIYKGVEKDFYLATSSSSPYNFTIGSWQAQKYMIKSIKDLEKN